MLSSYIIIISACLIFWTTYFLCKKRQPLEYSDGELVIFYLLVRLLPFFALENRYTYQVLCLAVEWVILGLLYYYTSCNKTQRMQRTVIAFYLFQPGTACCIINGNLKGMCIAFAVLALLCVLDTIEKKKQRSLMEYLPEYLIGNTGIYLWFVATGLLYQNSSQLLRTERIPVCYIVALGMMGIALIGILLRTLEARGTKEKPETEKRIVGAEKAGDKIEPEIEKLEEKKPIAEKIDTVESKKFGKRDAVWMAFLTLLFAVAVFFRLGSHSTPETGEHIQADVKGNNEIVLAFAEAQELSEIYIYPGFQSKRIFSLLEKKEDSSAWEVFEEKHEIESPFAWNKVELGRRVRSLKLVLTVETADLNEIVCLDGQGNQILPQNAEQYPELFDEQQLFVKNPSYYDQTMFDEVYHGRTAYEFLHGLSIYETTHPPLGKTLISIGIAIFGMNPFGWRFTCAVFGVLMIPLIYLFAFKLFSRTDLACFATVLAETAFMNTTLSRIATIDIIVAFFVLAMFFFMYGYVDSLRKKKAFRKQMLWLLGCGISMAFAVSTKWTGFYGAAGVAVIFFYSFFKNLESWEQIKKKKRYIIKTFLMCVLIFIGIPLTVYTLSYIPFVRAYPYRNLIQHVIENGKLMFFYHKDCVFEHPYSSNWYQWLMDIKPLADSRTYYDNGTVSVVMTFLNPVLCFGGVAALIWQFCLWRTKHSQKALFLLVSYFSMLLPWVLVHRTLFIYQYFISAMLFPLMLANTVRYGKHPKRERLLLMIAAVVFYILYYPVITGYPVKVEWVNQVLEIFEQWNIA